MLDWLPFDTEGWPSMVALLEGREWPRAAVLYDLRWLALQKAPRPGRTCLARRWGWSEKQVRLLLEGVREQAEARPGPDRGQVGARQGPGRGQVGARVATVHRPLSNEKGQVGASLGPGRGQTGARQGPGPLESVPIHGAFEPLRREGERDLEETTGGRADARPTQAEACGKLTDPEAGLNPKPTPSGLPALGSGSRQFSPALSESAKAEWEGIVSAAEASGGLPEGASPWSQDLGASSPALAGVVLRTLARVTGRPLPAPWGPDGQAMAGRGRVIDPRAVAAPREVLGLMRELGWPADFEAQAELVAEAMWRCPAPIFANDVRAEGWKRGRSRAGEVRPFCDALLWDARLEAALAWRRGPTLRVVEAPVEAPAEVACPPQRDLAAQGQASLDAWRSGQVALRESVGGGFYDVWLRDLRATGVSRGVLVLEAPSALFCGFIADRFAEKVVATAGGPVRLVAVDAGSGMVPGPEADEERHEMGA